ncbi:microcin C transport system permease protein [Sinobacterium caligoides]|uniref:Microcin C transport system permease protein n=1 Tax=Sinobacterium caligoides TaxID=933926 RepID=A0A3N2DJX8_9GAMM|nr:ABC transporter permease subunit [Sinobacterium caligoides]ROR99988.1 microcin C transport system permease protein [Sinobacterium caligoides]
MTSYFIRRLLLIVPTFIGITLLIFTITRAVPGGPIERMIQQQAMASSESASSSSDTTSGSSLSEDQLNELKAYYGFDKPILVSYAEWLGNIVRFDLGVSTRYHESVWHLIRDRLPVSLFYAFATLIITYGICIPFGIVKAIKHRSVMDNVSSIIVFIGYAIPGYVVGITLITLLASHWDIFPLGGFTSDNFDQLSWFGQLKDILFHATLPLIAYVAGSFAQLTLIVKNTLMDNLAADYVRTAVAKGVSHRQAILSHALRNSLIPLATGFGSNLTAVLGGSFLIEAIFNIDGMGLLGYESVLERDYPVVMGILAISALLFLLGNILSDFFVALVDPRVRFE